MNCICSTFVDASSEAEQFVRQPSKSKNSPLHPSFFPQNKLGFGVISLEERIQTCYGVLQLQWDCVFRRGSNIPPPPSTNLECGHVTHLLYSTFPPCSSSASRSWCRSWTPGSQRAAREREGEREGRIDDMTKRRESMAHESDWILHHWWSINDIFIQLKFLFCAIRLFL